MQAGAKAHKHSDPAPTVSLVRRFFAIEGMAIIVVLALLIALFMVSAPRTFLGYRIYMAFLASVPPPIILALGLTFVVIAGEMDLSFPSIVAFASYVFSALFKFQDLTFVAMAVTLVLSAGLGLDQRSHRHPTRHSLDDRDAGDAVLLGRPRHHHLERAHHRHPDRRWHGDPDRLRRAHRCLSRAVAMGAGDRGGPVVHPQPPPLRRERPLSRRQRQGRPRRRHPGRRDAAQSLHPDGLSLGPRRDLPDPRDDHLLPQPGHGLPAHRRRQRLHRRHVDLRRRRDHRRHGAGSLIVAIIEAGWWRAAVQGFWTRFLIGVVFVASVTLNAALEDPDRVPILRRLRMRLRGSQRRTRRHHVTRRERKPT